MDKLNTLLDISIGGGIVISLVDIQTYLGIGILAIQLILLITKGIIAIVKHVKNKNYDEAIKTIEKTNEDLTKLAEKINDKKEGE